MVQQANYNPARSRNYKTTEKLAPDAKILINGGFRLQCPFCKSFLVPENDITAVDINNNMNSSPSSASFTISAPYHDAFKYFDKGQFFLCTMMEVKIFMRTRYRTDIGGGKSESRYCAVFWGITTSVQYSYSQGTTTITVECADMLRWWQITRLNVNPTMTNNYLIPEVNAYAYSTIFENMTAIEIINFLKNVTLYSVSVPYDPFGQNQPSQEDAPNTSDVVYYDTHANDLIKYWQQRMSQIGKHLVIVGYDGQPINNPFEKVHPNQLTAENLKAMRDQANMNILGVTDANEDFNPYGYLGEIKLMGNNDRAYLDIAKEVASMIDYEFYQDTNGWIIFKPHFYNLDVQAFRDFRIEDLDIISTNFIENESEVVTVVDVKGSMDPLLVQCVENYIQPHARFVDWKMARKYGTRVQAVEANWINSRQGAFAYAVNQCSRFNSKVHQGSITIIGRPELRVGYPVYIEPLDMYVYVVGLAHSFNFGESFTTTIAYEACRRKYVPSQKGMDPKNIILTCSGAKDPTKQAEIKTDLKATEADVKAKIKTVKKETSKIDIGGAAGSSSAGGVEEIKIAPGEVESISEIREIPVYDEYLQTWILKRPNAGENSDYIKGNTVMSDSDLNRKEDIKNRGDLYTNEVGVDYKETINSMFHPKRSCAKIMQDLINNIPVSDYKGYELIGSWPYGSFIYIDENGVFTVSETRYEAVESIEFEQTNPEFQLPSQMKESIFSQQESKEKDYSLLESMGLSMSDYTGHKLTQAQKTYLVAHDENITSSIANPGMAIEDIKAYNADVGQPFENCTCSVFKNIERGENNLY